MDEPQNSQPVAPQEPVPPPAPDIHQTPPGSPIIPATIAGGMSGTVIAMIVALVVLVGGVGAYFIIVNKTPTSTTSNQAPNNAVTATSSVTPSSAGIAHNFTCRDVIPESDFKAITGNSYSDFYFKQHTPPELDFETKIRCSWDSKVDSNGVSSTQGRTYLVDINWKTPAAIFDDGFLQATYPNLLKVDGVGTSAWTLTDSKGNPNTVLTVLSSNKKYWLQVGIFDFNQEKEMARIIDANLNKY